MSQPMGEPDVPLEWSRGQGRPSFETAAGAASSR